MINQTEPITPEEEVDTIRKAKNGDEDARMLLLTSNIGLINKNINLMRNSNRMYNFNEEDAKQEAYISILKCIETFNPNLGYRFSTYIRMPIISALQLYGDHLRGVKKGTSTLISSFKKNGPEKILKRGYSMKGLEGVKHSMNPIISTDFYEFNEENGDKNGTPPQLITDFDLSSYTPVLDKLKDYLSPVERVCLLSRLNNISDTETGLLLGRPHQYVSLQYISAINKAKKMIQSYELHNV